MPQPEIDGYEILELIKEGACGSVYRARVASDSGNEYCAVRVFNALAINRPLIKSICERLTIGSYPEGVIPIKWEKAEQGGKCIIMPLLADTSSDSDSVTPRTLEHKLSEYPNKSAWKTVEKIAAALATMHYLHIPHGNLKPGNIFFTEDSAILLSDFATGYMPDVRIIPSSDAILYAPPEQLINQDGYTSGRGYTWDTFAFGIIAFRLLTGKLPQCEATQEKKQLLEKNHTLSDLHEDLKKFSKHTEELNLDSWSKDTKDKHELQHRAVIQRCLSSDPEQRYNDIIQVIQAWSEIGEEKQRARGLVSLKRKLFLSKLGMLTSIILAIAGALSCLFLQGKLTQEQSDRAEDVNKRNTQIQTLKLSLTEKEKSEQAAIKEREVSHLREGKLREQLTALGVANDRLLAWMLRDKNTDLPELRKTGPDKTAADAMERELRTFLQLTEGEHQFQPIRARILLQLSELEIHRKKPKEGTTLLDKAIPELEKANINAAGQSYRIARARLICLLQALDQEDQELSTTLLPKAKDAVAKIQSADPTETQRIKATMEIIEGRQVQAKDPAKALQHFQNAITNLKEMQATLPENIGIRSDLAKHTLQSSEIADTLDRIGDATKLRAEAIDHLRWLLAKNPQLTFAKIKLAKLEIIAAEADLIAGNESSGIRKLSSAEKMLESADMSDFSPDGAVMQIAITKGLRAVLLRDQRRITESAQNLNDAIKMTNKIVAANPNAIEPHYRLAGFYWQRASLSGDTGDPKTQLELGDYAAKLMQKVLQRGADKRDIELRRSLAYLYGTLGQSALKTGKKTSAVSYFKNAGATWQSLIDKDGNKSEYTEGLLWSKKRAE